RIDHYQPLSGTGGFDGWLFGICRHVVLDAQRAAGRRGYGPPADDVVHVDFTEGLVSAEDAAAVRAAFARLSDDDRELLELRVVTGASAATAASGGRLPRPVRDLARVVGISVDDSDHPSRSGDQPPLAPPAPPASVPPAISAPAPPPPVPQQPAPGSDDHHE